MKEEQFEKFMLLLANSKKEEPVTVKHDLVDSLSKVGVALCTAAILWVASQMQGLTTDMAVMKSQVNEFSKFTEAPRFTSGDNDAADQKILSQIKDLIAPIVSEVGKNENSINAVTRELDRRSDLFDDLLDGKKDVSGRVSKIELQLEMLDKK